MKLQFVKWQFWVAVAALVLVIIWFRNGNILATAESGIPFYDLQKNLRMTQWAWSSVGVGNSTGIITASTPTYLLLTRMQNAGVPGIIIEASVFWLILVTAGISVGLLAKEFFVKLPQRYLILAVLSYWFSPFVLISVWNRFLYNFMFFWALIPLAWFLFVRGIKLQDFKYAILVAISTTVLSYGLTSPAFVIILWFLFIYTTIFYAVFDNTPRPFLIKYFFLSLFCFVVFNLWWLSQAFVYVGTSGYEVAISAFFNPLGNLSTLSSISKKLGNLIDLIRLIHAGFVQSGPRWAGIYDIFIVRILEFFVAGIVFWTIWKFRKLKEVLFLGSLFIIILFLAKGIQDPFGEIFKSVFLKSTFFQVFRNPFEKFGFLLALCTSLLFTHGVWSLSFSKRFHMWIYPSSLFFLLFVWGLPFWSGLIFTDVKYPGSKEITSLEVKVPQYYKNADNFLKEEAKDSRLIVLPIGEEGITHTWEKPYRGIELTSNLFTTPGISLRTTIPFYYDLVTEISESQLSKNIIDFAPFTNTGFFLLRKDIDFKERRMANPYVVELVLKNLEKEGLLKEKFKEGKLVIYEVDEKYSWPKIYITNTVYRTNEKDLAKLSNFAESFPDKKFATIDTQSSVDRGVFNNRLIISPKKVSLQRVSNPTPKNLTEEDLLSRLFHAKHLPDRWYYPLIRLKEKLEEVSSDDYFGWLIYRNGILGKRAVEIYKLRNENAKERFILEAEEDYKAVFEELRPEIESLIARDFQVSRLVRDSLVYHWVLFDRAKSPLSYFLAEILGEWGLKPKFELPVSDKDYIIFSFNVPEDGDYDISFEGSVPEKLDLYLDGEIVISNKSYEGQGLKITSGEHEIAFPTGNFPIISPVLEQDDLTVSNNDNPSWRIDIPDRPTTYRIEFDYRFIVGEGFGLELVQDVDFDDSPFYSRGILKDEFFHGWKHWDNEFTTLPGADEGILRFNIVEKEECYRNWLFNNVCKKRKLDFEAEIKNFRLAEVKLPMVYLLKEEDQEKSETNTKVEWRKINPTYYKLNVEKESNYPEILVFSELFSSGWEAMLENEMTIPENKHYLVNSYANGWLLEEPGIYSVALEFKPQRFLYIGKIISGISVITGLIFLGLESWRRKR